ncbi:MAG: N-formylglutamate amidohydrolase, partial [Stellaceae bacterium]
MRIGFEIPGVLWRRDPEADELPLVFDSPHSGSHYPVDFTYACPLMNLRRAEDSYVDELYDAAPSHGATLIGAVFPRSFVDVNRAADDFDPALVHGKLLPHLAPRPTTRVGLIRRYARPGMPIYDRKLDPHEIVSRVATYHEPYH